MKTVKTLALAVLAAVLPVATAPALSAEPAAAVKTDDEVYADIIDAINEGVNPDVMLDRQIATLADQMAVADPHIIEAEAAFPGFTKALAQSMRPGMRMISDRVALKYRPRFAALFASHYTRAEAIDVAAFYRSPVGRRLMGGVQSNYDVKATVASALQEKDVSAGLEADIRTSTNRAVASLSREDLLELDRLARQKPALRKLGAVSEGMREIRLAMESEEPTPEEAAMMEKAIQAAGRDHVATFKAAKARKPLP